LKTCLSAKIPNEHKKKSKIYKFFNFKEFDTDLLIYVSVFDNSKDPYAAFGTACVFDSDQNFRPTVGGIQINLAYIKVNPVKFQKYVNLIIHELAHTLAISNKHY